VRQEAKIFHERNHDANKIALLLANARLQGIPEGVGAHNAWLEVVLNESRNCQIRRLLGAVGSEVLRLVRVDVGGVRLGELSRGAVRHLTPGEKAMLDVSAQDSSSLRRVSNSKA
jgi:23S rRNA pseudouridine2605 synthase